MEASRRHLLALALLSVLLVKLVAAEQELPALVLDETEPSKSPAAATSAQEVGAKDSTAGEKLIPYETKQPEITSAATITSVTTEQPSSTELPKSETPIVKDPSSQEQASTPSADAAPITSESSVNEKDINVLLANKNDADNDLAAPLPVEPSVNSQSDKEPPRKEAPIDLDASVETKRPTSEDGSADRFHYSMGDKVPETSSKPSTELPIDATTTPQPTKAPEEAAAKDASTPATPADSTTSDTKVIESQTITDAAKEEPKEEKKVETTTEDVKKIVASEEPVSEPTKVENPKVEPQPEKQAPEVEGKLDILVPKAESALVSTTTSSPSSTTTEQKSDSELEVKGDQPRENSKASDSSSTVAPSSTTTTIQSTTSEKPTTVKPAANVPSLIAVALGSALGAAVNPLFTGKVDKKSDPAVPASVSGSVSTTKAPLLGASSSTTRKSTTDRWDRWPPSTSSVAPTRRRPILPSIRRRFRPYNRFNPFPYGGPEPYNPVDFESEPSSKSPPRTTNKPRRRPSTESASSPKSRSTTTTMAPDSDSDDEPSQRPASGHRRREHHHHHDHSDTPAESGQRRRHRPHRNNPPFGHRFHSHRTDYDQSGYEMDDDRPLSNPRPFGMPSSGYGGLFNTGASSPGSGFDLLNPFSSWGLGGDSFGSESRPSLHHGHNHHHHHPSATGGSELPHRAPQPEPSHIGTAARPSGNRPVAVGGDYNSNSGRPNREHDYHGHEYEHDYEHDTYGPRPGRDCHGEHGYDRPPHRPGYDSERPGRDPYRPTGGDSYRPGRDPYRPNRDPYRPDRDPYRPTYRPYHDERRAEETGSGGSSSSKPERDRGVEASTASAVEASSTSRYREGSGGHRRPVVSQPERRPLSIFSPFDSLFSTIDDELFNLRSSLLDIPRRSVPPTDNRSVIDALVTSPKISMPAAAAASPHGVESKPEAVKPTSVDRDSKSDNAMKLILAN